MSLPVRWNDAESPLPRRHSLVEFPVERINVLQRKRTWLIDLRDDAMSTRQEHPLVQIGSLTPLKMDAFGYSPDGLDEHHGWMHVHASIPDDPSDGYHQSIDLGDLWGSVYAPNVEVSPRVRTRELRASVVDLPLPFLRIDYPYARRCNDHVVDVRLRVARHVSVGEHARARG